MADSDSTTGVAVQRYDLARVYTCYTSDRQMERSDDGEWVRFDDLEALRAEVARLKAIQQWQPIATAPWYEPIIVVGGSAHETPAVAHKGRGGKWLSDESSTPYVDPPTHWMPLPEPPSASTTD